MADQTGLVIGTTLRGGTYRIEGILGQGGFGITYMATDTTLDKKMAIKEFFPKNYCDRQNNTNNLYVGTLSAQDLVANLRASFIKEARNIAKLKHPNIVSINAAFEENNTAYYVMEHIEGDSLSDIVKNNGPLSIHDAITYIEKIGRALEYIHANRINHLDVKPGNIVIDRYTNEPILIDFGLSKHYDVHGDETSMTPMGISHGYAPLEQYNYGGIKEFSPQSDLYSLAATLYYLLTATTPPEAMALTESPLPFTPTFPYHLKVVIEKAMQPLKMNRYQNIGEFLIELSKFRPDSISQPIFPGAPVGQQYPQAPISTPISTPIPGSATEILGSGKPQPQSKKKKGKRQQQQQQQQQPQQYQAQPQQQYQAQAQPQQQYQAQPQYTVLNTQGFSQPVSPAPQPEPAPQPQPQPYPQGPGNSNIPPVDPPEIAPTPVSAGYDTDDDDEAIETPAKKKSPLKFILMGVAALAVIIVIVFIVGPGGDTEESVAVNDPDNTETAVVEETPRVENLPFNTPLGDSEYTGEVDNQGLPHGKGVAVFKSGNGKEYDGEWVHGKLEGKAKYTYASGDVYEGTFENNMFKHGKITMKENGWYFEGDFKNGQPDVATGKWYDKNGNEL